MKNPAAALVRSVVRWLRSNHRISQGQTITPEEFGRMLRETLAADPELARELLRPLIGSVIPIVAGACATTAATIGSGGFGTSCGPADTGDYTFPNSKVGIGTATPAVKLHVFAGASGQSTVLTGASLLLESNANHYLTFLNPAANEAGIIFGSSAGAVDQFLTAQNGVGLRFGTQASEKMRIAPGGNVGIGNSNPAEKLDVTGNAKVSGNLAVDTDVLFVNASTNLVGIGTANPSAKLDVDGGSGVPLLLTSTFQDKIRFSGGPAGVPHTLVDLSAKGFRFWDSSDGELLRITTAGIVAPLKVRLTNAAFSTAAGEDHGTASFAAGDGGMQAETGDTGGSYDETIGGLITFNDLTQTAGVTSGLNSSGAFLSARPRWNSTSIGANHKFWILAGGLDNGEKLRNGWGFKARDASGTKKLYGIVRLNGSEAAEVDLSTTLTTGSWLDLYAVVRSGAVDFYVNGVLKNTASTTLPSSAASTYEVRVENGGAGSGAGNAVLQVAYLTVGLPI